MHILNVYFGHRIGRLALSDFWLYELSIWLHTLAYSLVSVFIPAILIQDGYTLGEVILFYLLYNVIDVPLNFLARRLTHRIGARRVIVVSTVAGILFFLLFLRLVSHEWPLLIVMAALLAVYDAFWWVASLYLFIESHATEESINRSTGILYTVKNLAGLLGPIVGATIILIIGHNALLAATTAVFFLSLVPLLWVDDFPDKPARDPLPVRQFFSRPHGLRTVLTTMLYGIHDSVEHTLFPLFIFLVFGTIESVAGVAVAVSIAAILFPLLLGRISGAQRERAVAIGALLIAFIWISRIFVDNGAWYYVTISLSGVLAYVVLVPLDGALFDYGRGIGDALSASHWRNVAYMAANVVLYGLLALLVDVFNVSFLFAALCLFAIVGVNTIFIRTKPSS